MEAKTTKLPSIAIPFTLIFSLAALLFSYSAQYVWGMEPCKLCRLQRIPYFFTTAFSSLAFLPNFRKIAVRLIQLSFLVSLGLAIYHLLVIAGIIADPCSVPQGIGSIDDFQRMLNTPLSCSKMSIKFLGVPLAGHNAFVSLILLFILLRLKMNSS